MDPTDAIPLMQILGGYYSIWVLHAAAQLGIADLLGPGPRTAAELAAACQADEQALGRFLGSLELVGVVERVPGGRVALTPTGHWLRADVEGSLRASALMCGDASFFKAWAACAEAVRSGRPSFEAANGMPYFEYLDGHPEVLDDFQAAMSGFRFINDQIVAAYDFGRRRCVLDVGGGLGGLVRAVVERHPHVQAMVLDRPSVVEAARRLGRADGRIRWLAGDFLEAVPAGADTHVLRFVLSDWSDDDAVRILRNCWQSLDEDGSVLVVDNVRSASDPTSAAGLDLTMLVLTGGRARTVADYERLLVAAGFTRCRAIETPARATIVAADRSAAGLRADGGGRSPA
jgi:SAM-dependent methyltransferase